MQVSQMSDAVTHAVLGKKESREMGVSDSAALMHIFSTTLYTYPKLATVREVICNGWDGHIVVGKTDIPLQITLTNDVLRIRDFGPGIPDEKIAQIYGVFGNSTKRNDGTQTGGFGLGSKAPFAYTDNFEVTSHHGGIKSIYRVSKSSLERGGKPTIDTMVQLPTEETGIQVSIQLKNPSDADEFLRLIEEVLILGEIKASINGEPIVETLPLSESHTGYIIQNFRGTLTTKINIRYGNVVYPVPNNDHYAEMWNQVHRCMSHNLWNNSSIIFMAPPDSVTIAPSREALIFTEGTEETIKKLLMCFNPADVKVKENYQYELAAYQTKKVIKEGKAATIPEELTHEVALPEIQGTSAELKSGPYAFELRKAAINFMLSRRTRKADGLHVLLKRLRHAIYHGAVDKTMGERFHRALRKHHKVHNGTWRNSESLAVLQAVLTRNITYPLMKAVSEAEFIDEREVYFVSQSYTGSYPKFVTPTRYKVGNADNLVTFLYPKVLLARSQKAISEFMQQQRDKSPNEQVNGWVVYKLPVSAKYYEDTAKLFSDLGYEVHTYIPAPKVKKVDPNAPVKVAAPKKVSPKRKGYLSLTSAKTKENAFLLNHARDNCKPEDHIQDPVAYVVLNSKDMGRHQFGDMSRDASMATWKMFGDQVAVVTNSQVEKLVNKGVPSVNAFIKKHVDDALSSNPEFPRYLAFTKYFRNHGRAEGRSGIIRSMLVHKELMDTLPEIAGKKFRFRISPETEMLVSFFEDDSWGGMRPSMTKCLALEEKVKKSPMVQDIDKVMRESPWRAYVDLDLVGQALQKHLPGDPQLAVPYEIVRNLLK